MPFRPLDGSRVAPINPVADGWCGFHFHLDGAESIRLAPPGRRAGGAALPCRFNDERRPESRSQLQSLKITASGFFRVISRSGEVLRAEAALPNHPNGQEDIRWRFIASRVASTSLKRQGREGEGESYQHEFGNTFNCDVAIWTPNINI